MAIASIIRSAKTMPCGPPKPRKAVLETVLVRSRRVAMRSGGIEIGIVRMEHGAVADAHCERSAE